MRRESAHVLLGRREEENVVHVVNESTTTASSQGVDQVPRRHNEGVIGRPVVPTLQELVSLSQNDMREAVGHSLLNGSVVTVRETEEGRCMARL